MCIRDSTKAVAGDYGQVSEEYTFTEEDLWTPVTDTMVTVSKESLVQILLEKGVLTDEEVDEILVEEEIPIGFTRPTKDGTNPVWHSPMVADGREYN